ncbi:MAG TPA: glycosyltransferase family 2 protein [Candidatus Angelobacter sp.]|nr:glycosyltransferase family 2 protein [Candidatus Angelobacter sp.]
MTDSRQVRISIVTPSFNQGAFLEEALLSVKNQSYPATEHIVIDGGSADGSVEILKHYSSQPGWGHLRWVSEPDRGQGDALNKGFRMATGDIIGWLNSDDRYRNDCFKAIVREFHRFPQVDILYGDYTYINEEGRVWRIRREIEFSRFILLYLHMLYIPTTSSFFRRQIFDDGNWIDPKYHSAMDYDFILRLFSKGYTFQHISEILADFRLHPRSKTVAHPEIGLREHSEISAIHSPILRRVRYKVFRKFVLTGLRVAARTLRYSLKLLHGYYFEQFRPSVLRHVNPLEDKPNG